MTQNSDARTANSIPKPFFRQKWFLFLILVALLLFLIAIVIQLITPRRIATDQPNSWNKLSPGSSNLYDVQKIMGQPIDVESTSDGSVLSYKTVYPMYPNKIIADKSGTVTSIEEQLPPEDKGNIADFEQKNGSADLKLYTNDNAPLNVYVYLKLGVALLAHSEDGHIEQKWFFIPTDKDNFMKQYGSRVSETPEGFPERFDPSQQNE